MKKSFALHLVLAVVLTLGAVAFLPEAAQASCTGLCELDSSGGTFCQKCVDAGYETGALCQQSGQCFCYYIQCAYVLQSSTESFATPAEGEAAGLFVQPEIAAQTPTINGSCGPEEVLFGLPVG